MGSVDCVENDIRKKVLECANRPNSFAFGIGDYADSITKNDPRMDMNGLAEWVEKTNIVESQRKRVKELLSPLSEEGKLLVLGTGNHEEEIHMRHDNDIVRNLCDDLKVPYGGYGYFLVLDFVRVEGHCRGHHRQYVIHAWHGAGAAQTEGARLSRLMRLVNDIEADIYVMGHLHAITIHTPDRLVCRDGRVKAETLIALISGSWLKTYTQPKDGQQLNPSYGEKKGYKPSRIGSPLIQICPDKDWFKVEV